jgi:hypothetical protein
VSITTGRRAASIRRARDVVAVDEPALAGRVIDDVADRPCAPALLAAGRAEALGVEPASDLARRARWRPRH